MKTLLQSALVPLLAFSLNVAAQSNPASPPHLKDHGLRAGPLPSVLPQNAIIHLQINQPQRILESLERFIVSAVPDRLLPGDLQGLFSLDHPLLTLLGMQTIQAPLTADQIAEKIGLNTDEPASLTLYPGLPPRSLILSLPVKNHAVLEGFLKSVVHAKKAELSSLADKPFVRLEFAQPIGPLRELYLACSADRLFITGEQSLLLLLYPDNSFPRLKDNKHFAEIIGKTAREDVWITFDPALIKPILPQIQFFEYLPLQFVSQQRAELLRQVPPQQRQMIEQRLRLQFGVQSLEQLADYAECLLTATYEELFEFLLTSLKSFNGVSLAAKMDASFPQFTVLLHSDGYKAGAGTLPVPMDAVRTALSRIPGQHDHLTVSGRQPKVEPSAFVTSWLKRIRGGFEAKNLNLALVEAFETLHRQTIHPQPVGTQVPWMITTRSAVNPPPSITSAESLRTYFRDLGAAMAYPSSRTVTIVPGGREHVLENSLRAECEALLKNQELAYKTFSPEPGVPAFLEAVYRLKPRQLDRGVRELTWETAFVTRGGFFGFNQHELISRRVYFSRNIGDYTVYHQASKDPNWIGGLELQSSPKLSPAVAKMLERVPEGASSFCIHRPLADLPGVLKWVEGFEDLVHRDAEAYLSKARGLASATQDQKELVRKLAAVKFSPAVYSINRDQASGEVYCLLPGNIAFPRPKIVPAVTKLFAEFNRSADDQGGFMFYTREVDGRYEASAVQSTEAIARLIKTVGNAVQQEYLSRPERMPELHKMVMTERDMNPSRMNEILLRNPDWEFLPRGNVQWPVARPVQKTDAKPHHAIAPREAQASDGLIDLTSHFNASPNDSWHAGGLGNNDLKALPQGIQEFAGVKFDVRGIIQVSGQDAEQQLTVRFPKEVCGIKVEKSCGQLHFLHATGWQSPDGTKVGLYRVHYQDGQTQEIPVLYGTHVRDWWTPAGSGPVTESQVAWKGSNEASQSSGVNLQLYKTTWKNPRPDARIASLDYVSCMSRSAPFLIGITAE